MSDWKLLTLLGGLALLTPIDSSRAGQNVYYGTTAFGGAYGYGTIFRADGKHVTVLYNFCTEENCADGANPESNLVQLSDGSLVGTTAHGGGAANDDGGVLFTFAPVGTPWALPGYHVRWRFCFYWMQCTRFGRPRGTLQAFPSESGAPQIEGTESANDGRGVLWTARLVKPDITVISLLHSWKKQ